jgi:nucleobase:cation symporter-1, NCS1 family
MAGKEKVKVWARKLAVESEPGLTNAQLMLTNHDLKPVEPERRQWGPWNFVGFWVADSFNIVSNCEPTILSVANFI